MQTRSGTNKSAATATSAAAAGKRKPPSTTARKPSAHDRALSAVADGLQGIPPKIFEVLADYPLPEGVAPLAYGTSGFRAVGTRLPPVAARVAILTGLKAIVGPHPNLARSRPQGPQNFGVMITASHNAAPDNGLKLVDLDGGMLHQEWEPAAAQLAAAADEPSYRQAIADIVSRHPALRDSPLVGHRPAATKRWFQNSVHVFIGHDTRETSPAVLGALTAGLAALGIPFTVVGLVTTPQIHYHVYTGASAETSWVGVLADSYRALMALLPQRPTAPRQVVIDCANGVGGHVLRRLAPLLKGTGGESLTMHLGCTDGQLNHECGADFCQKERKVALALHNTLVQAVESNTPCNVWCIDGDADRVVGFDCFDAQHKLRGPGEGTLLDGDRFIVLCAIAVNDLVRRLGPEFADIRVGVVQTAYANGGSTHYIRETLKIPVLLAATGVKHVHHAALGFDIGIYYEANGHGTVLIDEPSRHAGLDEPGKKRMLERLNALVPSSSDDDEDDESRVVTKDREGLLSPEATAAKELLTLCTLLSQSCGDAIGNILAAEYMLTRMGLTFKDWVALYSDLPSKQVKVKSSNHTVVKTTPDETQATAPAGLQGEIDAAVSGVPMGRSFVRPSGTEPIIRVYAESSDAAATEQLAARVVGLVQKYAP